MAARPDTSDGLEDLQVRVIRIDELGRHSPATRPGPIVPTPTLAPVAAAQPTPAVPRSAAGSQPLSRATSEDAPPAQTGGAAAPPIASRDLPRAKTEGRGAARLITPGRVFFVTVALLLFVGWKMPTERYITPKRGIGYALGIIGGTLMLLLLVYSLRKRYEWLRFLGTTPSWFRFHMVLGILGPLCILYHANFTTGAANSNVALFAMLIVAGSGLIGRYIYAHIHNGLYGRKLDLHELRAGADSLRSLSGSVGFLPELVTRLEQAERQLLNSGPKLPLLGFARPAIVAIRALLLRWRLNFYVRRALRAGARRSAVLAAEHKRLHSVARAYVGRRLAASRRVAGFEGYERLFSLWHALHIPLIFMMIIAAVIHVIAVHVY